MRTTFAVLIAIIGSLPARAAQSGTTFDDVKAGMKCHQNVAGDMECNYHVGRSLRFGIAGVGERDASIYFYSASSEGDYFALVGLSHGCVVVKPGRALGQVRAMDVAFVSPRSGKVYSTWEACQERK